MPEREAGENIELRRLPAGRILVDLDRAAQLQLELRGLTPDFEDHYPSLAVLWVRVEGLARVNQPRTSQASLTLFREWGDLNLRLGRPEDDDWRMFFREALYRYKLMSDYLTDAGPYGFDSGEADSPKHYVNKREAEISRGGT